MWLPEFLIFFFSTSYSSKFSIFRCSDCCVWSWSLLGPCHNLWPSLYILEPLFQRLAGFSNARTYYHSIKPFPLILDILLLTNVLYFPLSFNHWRTVVLSDHLYIFLTVSLLRRVLTFTARNVEICVSTNLRRCIDKSFLANLDLLVIKFWLNIFCWFTTAYATVQTPIKFASLNKWISV